MRKPRPISLLARQEKNMNKPSWIDRFFHIVRWPFVSRQRLRDKLIAARKVRDKKLRNREHEVSRKDNLLDKERDELLELIGKLVHVQGISDLQSGSYGFQVRISAEEFSQLTRGYGNTDFAAEWIARRVEHDARRILRTLDFKRLDDYPRVSERRLYR